MELKVTTTKKNRLFARDEIVFEVNHADEPTPKIVDVRRVLSDKLASKLETTFIVGIEGRAGSCTSVGVAHSYESEEDAKRIEPRHVITLNMDASSRQEALKQLVQKRAEAKSKVGRGEKK